MHASGLFFLITLNLMTLYFLFKWEIKIVTAENYGYTREREDVIMPELLSGVILGVVSDNLNILEDVKLGLSVLRKSPVRQQRLWDIKEKGNYIGYF